MAGRVQFRLSTAHTTAKPEICREFVNLTKDYVFEHEVRLTFEELDTSPMEGYAFSASELEFWKLVAVLVELSRRFDKLLFWLGVDSEEANPLYKQLRREDVLPDHATFHDAQRALFGYGGGLVWVPSQEDFNTHVDSVHSHKKTSKDTILSEVLQQCLQRAQALEFGMHRIGANLPASLAFIAERRPDLLAHAVHTLGETPSRVLEELDDEVEAGERVMVHVRLNSRDWNSATELADIESPTDIVSHRLAVALLAHNRHVTAASATNGHAVEGLSELQERMLHGTQGNPFERVHIESLLFALSGCAQSRRHAWSRAVSTLPVDHITQCKRIFQDGVSNTDSCSGDDEATPPTRRSKRGRRRKRVLAAPKNSAALPAIDSTPDEEQPGFPTNALGLFERQLNGEEPLHSSEGDELGGDEPNSMYSLLPSQRKKKGKHTRARRAAAAVTARPAAANTKADGEVAREIGSHNGADEASDGNDAFDMGTIIDGAPPLATVDDFDL